MRTKPLQDLTGRVPEVAATGLDRVRRGGQLVAESVPVASVAAHVGDGLSKVSDQLSDLVGRANVSVPTRIPIPGRRPSPRPRLARRGGILALVAAFALAALFAWHRRGQDEAGHEAASGESGDRTAMPPLNAVDPAPSADPVDAALPGARRH